MVVFQRQAPRIAAGFCVKELGPVPLSLSRSCSVDPAAYSNLIVSLGKNMCSNKLSVYSGKFGAIALLPLQDNLRLTAV